MMLPHWAYTYNGNIFRTTRIKKKFLDACQDTRSSNQYCEYEITDGNQRIHAKSKKVATLHKSY